MSNPRFTVIIPTRERCDTLYWTLKTCVAQTYDNLEIIVSDNASSDDTKIVVDSFADNRIRYVNPGRRLSMSANWEFALGHVVEGYLTFIGDDDGLLPSGVNRAAELISALGSVPILAWGRPVYNWPNHPRPGMRNTLFFHSDRRLLRLDAHQYLRAVAELRVPWASLPSVYNSFVHVDVINHIKTLTSGKFFQSSIPDVYSAVAIASTLQEYQFSMQGMAMAGISAKSTGTSFSNPDASATAAASFLAENDLPTHHQLVMSSLASVCVTECLLQARDHRLLPDDIQIDIKRLINSALLEVSEEPTITRARELENVRTIGVKNHLEAYVEAAISQAVHFPAREYRPVTAWDVRRKGYVIACEQYGVCDVYGAALLCEQLWKENLWYVRISPDTVRMTVRSYLPYVQKHSRRVWSRIRRKRLRKLG